MSVGARLHEFVEALLDRGEFVASVEAERFVKRELAEHPRQFHEWLKDEAADLVRDRITHQARGSRASALSRARRSAFAEHADAISAGDEEALGLFKIPFVVDDSESQRSLGKMTGADCQFVANRYEASGRFSLLMARFLDKLGERAGDGAVEDVMSEEDAERIWRSMGGGEGLSLAA